MRNFLQPLFLSSCKVDQKQTRSAVLLPAMFVSDLPMVVSDLPMVVSDLPMFVSDLPMFVSDLSIFVFDLTMVVFDLLLIFCIDQKQTWVEQKQ